MLEIAMKPSSATVNWGIKVDEEYYFCNWSKSFFFKLPFLISLAPLYISAGHSIGYRSMDVVRVDRIKYTLVQCNSIIL